MVVVAEPAARNPIPEASDSWDWQIRFEDLLRLGRSHKEVEDLAGIRLADSQLVHSPVGVVVGMDTICYKDLEEKLKNSVAVTVLNLCLQFNISLIKNYTNVYIFPVIHYWIFFLINYLYLVFDWFIEKYSNCQCN